MKRFVEGADREQVTLFPECFEDYVGDDNPVRVIDIFVDQLVLGTLGFSSGDPAVTGKPATSTQHCARPHAQDGGLKIPC